MPAPPLHAESLEQLRAIQAAAAARLTEDPSIARLFLVDPLRALDAVGVTLSPRAIEDWRKVVGTLPNLSAESFSLLRSSTAQQTLKITIRGLLPPVGMTLEREEGL
jgi:hypothetical protein